MQLYLEDILAVLPFIVAVSGGLLIILLDVFTAPETKRTYLGAFALVTLTVAAASALAQVGTGSEPAFSGMVVGDDLSRFLTALFSAAAGLAVLVFMGRQPPEGAIRGELYALLLFSTAGAALLTQAVDLVALFIGLEMLSIPAYVLAAGHKNDRRSVEAGFKYFVLGAFSSAFLVYGIALVYGSAGGTDYTAIAVAAADWTETPLLVVGALMLLVGLCFKIGAAPFHMWAPDVYQGAPTAATVFFSTGVKAAAFATLIRLLYAALPDMRIGEGAFELAGWYPIFQGLALLTMTVANLTALVQTDVKRILSYSSVAHAGYLFIGLLTGESGASAVLFYLAAYTFMTAGAFALVAYLEREDGGAALQSYRGIGRARPIAAACLSVFLFSLAGIPPTAGFFAKLYLFKTAVDQGLAWLVVVAVLNSAASAYYYLRITVAMYMEPADASETGDPAPSMAITVAVAICIFFVLAMGLYPAPYLEAARASVAGLF